MTGIEFAIVHEVISTEPSTPNLWIIQKRYRRGPAPDDVNPIATYYIININIYQSPSIYSVIANRLVKSFRNICRPSRPSLLTLFSVIVDKSFLCE